MAEGTRAVVRTAIVAGWGPAGRGCVPVFPGASPSCRRAFVDWVALVANMLPGVILILGSAHSGGNECARDGPAARPRVGSGSGGPAGPGRGQCKDKTSFRLRERRHQFHIRFQFQPNLAFSCPHHFVPRDNGNSPIALGYTVEKFRSLCST